jgi:hypothetical protein
MHLLQWTMSAMLKPLLMNWTEQPLTAKKSKLNFPNPAAAVVVAGIAEEAVAADMVVVGIGTVDMAAVGVTAMVGVAVVTGMAAAVADVMTADMVVVAVAAAEADVMTMIVTAVVTVTEATTVGMTKPEKWSWNWYTNSQVLPPQNVKCFDSFLLCPTTLNKKFSRWENCITTGECLKLAATFYKYHIVVVLSFRN